MSRPTVAHIDLGALAHNARAIGAFMAARRGAAAPALVGVVKADAYGHGAVQVARTLVGAGAAMLACADIEEGVELREAGIAVPILVFGPFSLGDLDAVFDASLTPTVIDARPPLAGCRTPPRGGVCAWPVTSASTPACTASGCVTTTWPGPCPRCSPHRTWTSTGVYTHFATADAPGDDLFATQRRNFDRAMQTLAALGVNGCVIHAANSGALLAEPATWFDLVRPGLLMYGVAPRAFEGRIGVKPVMSVRSRVAAVKGVRVGESIGYGGRFIATRPTTMAVVPAGTPTASTRGSKGAEACSCAGGACPLSAPCRWTCSRSTSRGCPWSPATRS